MAANPSSATAFDGNRRLAGGPLIDVAMAVKAATEAGAAGPLLVFDDATAQVIDLDLRGSRDEIAARLAPREGAEPAGRGRPKLGVIGREVTLLPRQWEWLAAQPGGASVTLRKLVNEARKNAGAKQQARAAQEAAYRFMSALAGDLSGYEEATRALFAGDRTKFAEQIAAWPEDVRAYAMRLAFPPAE